MTGTEKNWRENENDYRAFLLRCWREADLKDDGQPGERSTWRFALAQLNRDEKQGFASLDELLAFLSGEFEDLKLASHSEE